MQDFPHYVDTKTSQKLSTSCIMFKGNLIYSKSYLLTKVYENTYNAAKTLTNNETPGARNFLNIYIIVLDFEKKWKRI